MAWKLASKIIRAGHSDGPPRQRLYQSCTRVRHSHQDPRSSLSPAPPPLDDRLKQKNRLTEDPHRETYVVFKRPYRQTVEDWGRVAATIFALKALSHRYTHQARPTYIHRAKPLAPGTRPVHAILRRGGNMMARLIWHVGLRSNCRAPFGKFSAQSWPAARSRTFFQLPWSRTALSNTLRT